MGKRASNLHGSDDGLTNDDPVGDGLGYVPLRPADLPDPGPVGLTLDQTTRLLAAIERASDDELVQPLQVALAKAARNARNNHDAVLAAIRAIVENPVVSAAIKSLTGGIV